MAVLPIGSVERAMSRDMTGSTVGRALNEDLAGGAVTEGNAIAIDLADDRRAAGHLGHQGGFTEAEFAHPLAKMPLPCQLAHATGRASRQLAKRKAVEESHGILHGEDAG